MGVVIRLDVEDVAGRGFWNHQRVARYPRHDVEEGEHVLILVNLVAGEFTAQDLCEDIVGVVGGHGGGSPERFRFLSPTPAKPQSTPAAPFRDGAGPGRSP